MQALPRQKVVYDALLVGGGLQNSLIALAIWQAHPGARLAMVERGSRVGGNHTWSFHSGDVPASASGLVDPLVVARWPSHDVAFPGLERTLDEPYATISSERLAEVIEARFAASPGSRLVTSAEAVQVEARRVVLRSGDELHGLVVDARGPERLVADVAGYQKFVGLELHVEHGTAPRRPVLMDARVRQRDGFRFFYVLPLDETRVLVEDTYFSDSPTLDRSAVRAEVLSYAARRGMAVRAVGREEHGVLPMPAAPPAITPPGDGPVVAGYAGGWLHPTTAYSFPVALRLALCLASELPTGPGPRFQQLVADHLEQLRFATLLNRLLFRAFAPEHRWNVLERFYRLPADTVRRFYALETRPHDRLRILVGRPPRGMTLSPRALRGALT